MKPCRECQREVSEQAMVCPQCGAPYPFREKWNGFGWEYKSPVNLLGQPLIHISFKYTINRRPVPAKGIIAIGQFACGLITVAQFGIGILSVSQFTIAGFALAQFAVAWSLTAQMGIFLHDGRGQMVLDLLKLIGMR